MELYEAIPLTPELLKQCCIEYKGSYRFWTGKLNFLSSHTRYDIAFPVQRLSEYNNAPTLIAFQSIVRLLRYLAGDILRPIMYPRKQLDTSTTVTWFATPETNFSIKVSHMPTVFADAELGRCLATRRSYYCIIITVLNVVVFFKICKSTTVQPHTTASEINASYKGIRYLEPIRTLFAFSGHPLAKPSDLYTDNSAVQAVVESERMTTRCRHLDIPIAFLHESKGILFEPTQIRTQIMLADMGTKPNTPSTLRLFKYWSTGAPNLPQKGHKHYDLLQMQYYEINLGMVQQLIHES